MVSAKSVEDQLTRIKFVPRLWNKPECVELATILLPDEEIFECVNGWYEGGFALLCATSIRVLLVDKKPFKYLTVEDVRFDTINQIDYSHRMYNASICITASMKSLKFKSYNQPRLRKLISHVQNRMAELKRYEQEERAKNEEVLQGLDSQIKDFILSQFERHKLPEAAQPELKAISTNEDTPAQEQFISTAAPAKSDAAIDPAAFDSAVSSTDLYEDGLKEIFGKYEGEPETQYIKAMQAVDTTDPLQLSLSQNNSHVFDTNPLKIAYSKLPMILSSKRRKAATFLGSDSI